MATKRLRGGRWHFTVKRAGLLPAPVYLSFENEKEGDEYVRRLEALLDRGVVPDDLFPSSKRSAPTLRERARRYLSDQHVAESDRTTLRVALESLPATIELRALTFVWATAWVTKMKREENLAPSTLRHRVGALARCLDWLAAHGDLPMNPLRLLPKGYAVYTAEDSRVARDTGGVEKLSEERDRRLEKSEEQAIRRILQGEKPKDRQRSFELPDRDALVLLFDMALESGMRLREMFTLERKQVDLRRRTIFLDKTKNGSKRQVPLTSILRKLLLAYRGDYEGRLFPWWSGEHKRRELERVTSLLSRQFSRIFGAAKCENLHFHDLRHEATSRFFERTTLDAVEIAKIVGHKSVRSLMRYANLRASRLAGKLW